jgi:large subunit ribosomal protein L15
VNVKDLARFESGTRLDPAALRAAGLVDKESNVKILGDGELSVPLHLFGVKLSASARQKIESAGGTIAEGDGTPGNEDAITGEETTDASGSA